MTKDAVTEDPAIERFNRMREEAYLSFRWTRRTARTALLGVILVPGVLLWVSSKTNLKWHWTGKTKGETLSTTRQNPS